MRRRTITVCRERGFTLIEIVIAISILSLILITAYNSLNKLIRTQQLLDDQRDVTAIANSILSRMTRELQLLTTKRKLLPPRSNLEAAYNDSVHIVGEAAALPHGNSGDQITFVAHEAGQYVPDGLTHAGIVQITYRVEEDPERESGQAATYYLIRDEVPAFEPAEKAYKSIMTFPVSKNLVSLSFRYFDARTEEWSNEWPKEKRGVPHIISFSVKIQSPAGKIHAYTTAVPLPHQDFDMDFY